MGSLGFKHAFVAAAVSASTACSIWAALDDPYKSDVAGDSGAPLLEAGVDANRVVDAGFIPYAVAAHGDTVYAIDNRAQVHVAYDAGTSFVSFWQGDGGVFIPPNGIAASGAGVFWTTTTGIRYCALDGGACGVLELPATSAPRAIAASDTVVAWNDVGRVSTGVNVCNLPLSQCTPTTLPSMNVQSIAVGPDGTVAWAEGGQYIRFSSRPGNPVKVSYAVNMVATDFVSGNLYWAGPFAVGVVHFDGTGNITWPQDFGGKPSQLFAVNGSIYWSVPVSPPTVVAYCAFESDGGCSPKDLQSAVLGHTTNNGIIANSREVLTVVSSTDSMFPFPEMLGWRVP
jgi:hypothetical protein